MKTCYEINCGSHKLEEEEDNNKLECRGEKSRVEK